jgi:erythromycin esterase
MKKQVIPLSTVEAGSPLKDLEAFGKAVGDARLVALGEATHGTREIFQMKHRLLEYLVREKGFTVFAIEANWPESEAADRYIKTGEGDPKAALSAMGFWTWQTEEVLAMLTWMREFNKAPGEHPILSFTSFDMQRYEVARDGVLAYFKHHAPQELPAVETAYDSLRRLNPDMWTDPGFGEAAKDSERVVTLLEARRDALTRASSPQSFRDVFQMSRIVAQAANLRATGGNPRYREQVMAQNIEWLLKDAYPGEKIVVWAHNGHVSTRGSGPMGSWLRKTLGPQLYVVGFAIHTGSVRAMTREEGVKTRLVESKLPQADAGTGTAILSAVAQPLFFLDLKKPMGILGQWLSEAHMFRSCDAFCPANFMSPDSLSQSYDGLIYMESTHAARGI